MSPAKHNDETKRYAAYNQFILTWLDALFSAKEALKQANVPNQTDQTRMLVRVLSFQAFVAYARPFVSCHGLTQGKDIPDIRALKNDELVNLRHEIAAHTDAKNHAYVDNVIIANGKVVRNHVPTTNLLPFMHKVIDSSQKAVDWIAPEIRKLEDEIDKLNLTDGTYSDHA